MGDQSATSIAMEQRTKEVRERRFNVMAQHFFRRWQPDDRDEAAQFSADLFTLVREVYADALQPVGDTVKTLMATQAAVNRFKL